MDSILKINTKTDSLNEEYQGLLEEHYILESMNSHFKSRAYINQMAENELSLFLPDDFCDYAFYEMTDDKQEITMIQYLMPVAEAFSFKVPKRIQQ